MFNCCFVTIKLYNLPVFEPNDYFWANHWDGKEEKWQAYARAIREIIANKGKFELFDIQMEDKLMYKEIIRGKKKA